MRAKINKWKTEIQPIGLTWQFLKELENLKISDKTKKNDKGTDKNSRDNKNSSITLDKA